MRRLGILIVVLALSVAGAATVAQATNAVGLRAPVAVTPARGTPTTTFRITFTTPVATGSLPGLRSWEIASVAYHGESSRSCTNTTARRLPAAAAHQSVSVTFPVTAKRWCTGSYAGTIMLYRSIVCHPTPASRPTACPEIAFAPEAIGRFQFTVAAPRRS
jgi:hypothetical protein